MLGRTTFIVAHRLSTLRGSDFLLVLEQGHSVAVRPDVEVAIRELESSGRRHYNEVDVAIR